MSFWRLFYHVVWGTKKREALIDEERAVVIERSVRATCHELGVLFHAIGLMPDHVHLAISIPPRYAIAQVVQRLKGESSHLLNHSAARHDHDWFTWQPEYGVLSLGERSLADVVAYVENQRAHHAANSIWPTYELIDRPPDQRRTDGGARSSPGGAL